MFKKTLAAVTLCLFALLTACSSPDQPDEFEGYKKAVGFKASVSAESSKFSFSFDLIRQKPDKFDVTFTQPSTLKNFKLISAGEDFKLSFYGFSINLSRLPIDIGGVKTVLDTLKQFDEGLGGLELKTRDDEYIVYGGVLGKNTIEFTLNAGSFSPVSININGDEEWKIILTDFSLITEPLESLEGESQTNG